MNNKKKNQDTHPSAYQHQHQTMYMDATATAVVVAPSRTHPHADLDQIATLERGVAHVQIGLDELERWQHDHILDEHVEQGGGGGGSEEVDRPFWLDDPSLISVGPPITMRHQEMAGGGGPPYVPPALLEMLRNSQISGADLDAHLYRGKALDIIAAKPAVKSVSQRMKEAMNRLNYMAEGFLKANEYNKGPISRPDGGGQSGRPLKIISNHFPLTMDFSKPLYKYSVEILVHAEPGSTPDAGFGGLICADLDSRHKKSRKFVLRKNWTVLEKIVSQNGRPGQVFHEVAYAFDGTHTLITNGPIGSLLNKEMRPLRLTSKAELEAVPYQCSMELRFVSFIDMTGMGGSALEGGGGGGRETSPHFPFEGIHALDILLRHGPTQKGIPVGESLFQSHSILPRVPIGGGLLAAKGHYQSVLPTSTGATLCIDRSVTAFYQDGHLLDFIQALPLVGRSRWTLQVPMSDALVRQLSRELRDIKVLSIHTGIKKRQRLLRLTSEPIRALKFDWEEEQPDKSRLTHHNISVPEYFQKRYGIHLRYPHLPAAVVKCGSKEINLPVEMLMIEPNQHVEKSLAPEATAELIRRSASELPYQRLQFIQHSAAIVARQSFSYIRPFGIAISSEPLSVSGRILDAPSLEFNQSAIKRRGGGGGPANELDQVQNQLSSINNCNNGAAAPAPLTIQPKDGRWQVQAFHSSGTTSGGWILVNMEPQLTNDQLDYFSNAFARRAVRMKMDVGPLVKKIQRFLVDPGPHGDTTQALEEIFAEKEEANLFIFILPRSCHERLYQDIKFYGDIKHGVTTSCVQGKKLRNLKDAIIAHMMLKLNTKLGGHNSILSRYNQSMFPAHSMVVGIDVSHPSRGDHITSSLSAAVGSTDENFSQYHAALSVQPRCASEIIVSLDGMIVELLTEYRNINGTLPEYVVMYRDGVSFGQFGYVYHEEIPRVQMAFAHFGENYKPKLTFMIVQKRHHTRFFVQEERDGVGHGRNIPPGLVIDSEVTTANGFDFFLCSHTAVQGTSRPSHYFCIYDDSAFGSDQIQKMTYYLAHTYARCSKSIAIPAPVAYAHLAATRARQHVISLEREEALRNSARNGGDSLGAYRHFPNGRAGKNGWGHGGKNHKETPDEIRAREANIQSRLRNDIVQKIREHNQMYFI